ncbi:hypothetical protein ACQI5H_22595, partial [Mycobacterium heidelbergense]
MVFDIATLHGLAADIGAPIPNGDPDALFALADHIEASAQAWDGHADELAQLKAQLRSVLAGDTAEAHDQQLAKLLDGPDSLQGDSEAVRAGVAALRNYAADLEDNQSTSLLLVGWLLATTIRGIASAAVTGGESLVEVALARVRTAAAINALKEALWRRIATVLTELLANTCRGVLFGGAEQLALQSVQIARGERTSLNGQLITETGLSFAKFGGPAEAVERGLLWGVAGVVNDSKAASVAAWATSKVLSGIGGNTFATAIAGDPITLETLRTGALMGVVGAAGDVRGTGGNGGKGAPAVDTKPNGNGFTSPAETTHDAGPQAHTAPAPAPTAEPAKAAGEHSAGTPAAASPAAADPGARPVEATATRPPATADAGHMPVAHPAAGVEPPPATHASASSHLQEGTVDISTGSQTAHTGPPTATASP